MELKKISNKVFYYPHQPETDRPMLVYLKGEKIALAVDAGNSADHVDEFYKALKAQGLKMPDLTVLTHWHWDHTFGMHHIHGLSIAHRKTNEFLGKERAMLSDSTYVDFAIKNDECLCREYADGKSMVVVPSDIQFEEELTLNLGEMTAKIFHAESPHSEDTALIYVPEEKILFLGDATSEDFFNDGFMDKEKLEALIKLIECTDCQYCILSHTEPLPKPDLLHYLKSI
ncbi:metallo-beta-lactamase superfamily protein [Hydrogenoanaerobacterium saccharovorans]|uniref:Metallo-beta-lactamase superfamily protein n=1 Tax=Hydrogenoanaerobacterium saccharovorans TaxID=474960 RepID=A0A1H8CQT9_9FIRM|nr:MBL fold metallo-hydrolase [Hydrogenoanaerobacterium saccharovorans]RPF43238.1 metallo-beta-lactamase superfamily protein [Hydrogenoanaerobacterium saccharovorans]SEM96804.1 Metallo-beta-lactamase superfamily protein [Hydrogenoanaerobacterium saccharovorans]